MNKKVSNQTEIKEQSLLVLPFYGIKGSISKVDEEENYYLVTRYGIDGNDDKIFPIPKKRKKELMSNYKKNLKEYLEINNTKYQECQNKQLKKKLSKKKLIIATSILICTASSSILGTVFTTGNTSNAFLATFFFTFIASCHEMSNLKKCKDDEKAQAFMHEYKTYLNKLNELNIKKDKEEKRKNTHYSKIKQNKNKVIDIEKKKLLEKKSA